MREIVFSIDGEPRGQSRPRMNRKGWLYKKESDVSYEKLVSHAFNGEKITGAVNVKITAYLRKAKSNKMVFPTKKPDVDNIAKIIMDGLNGTAWDDDKQVTKLTVVKKWDEYPRVEVMIREVVE